MCGRYFIATDEEIKEINEIIQQVSNKYRGTEPLSRMKTGEIFPTNIVPVLTRDSAFLMKWGFPRFDGKGQIINARSETVMEKPLFRKPFLEHRCLVPATHYFEWETRETGKVKYAIGLKEPIYMAGLYRFDKDPEVPQFVIITRPASPGMAFIHDRMPLIIPEHKHRDWFSKDTGMEEIIEQSATDLIYKTA